jgi:anthranilate/para-aminobenzoate synthase component I
MLASLPVDAPAEPFAVARALADRPGLALVRAEGGRVTYVACDPVATSRAFDPEPALALAARSHGEIPRWIGVLPYEARRTLERATAPDPRPEPEIVQPLWRRYPAIVKITCKVEVLGDSPQVVEQLGERLLAGLRRPPSRPPARLTLRVPPEAGAAHRARILSALELIRAGEIYQVNLARRFELAVEGAAHELLAALVGNAPPPHALSLDWPELGVAMASPELFLGLEPGGRAFTRPIKGTRPRGNDPARDRELIESLDSDPKERAELAMVIDVERNDLGRLAVPGSVHLVAPPAVETHASVHHRAATVEATLLPEVTREALLLALLPSGSVTGAPKIRAMEVIADLEPARRGLYTGAAGFIRQDGGLELGMAIRTVVHRHGHGAYYAGGGIVADSDPDREVEETLWKAQALIDLVGGGENWA